MAGQRQRRRSSGSPMATFTILGACMALVAGAASRHWTGMPVLLAYLAGVNLATFGLYAYDKSGAKLGLLRVPENTLHLFALAGGTPSALMAQVLLRHKTSLRAPARNLPSEAFPHDPPRRPVRAEKFRGKTPERKFRIVFWAVAAVQVALLGWLAWSWR